MKKLQPRPAHAAVEHRSQWTRRRPNQRGFLLIMVLLVVSMLSLAALNFSESMLIAHETSRLDSQRFQARMMVESGLQTVRLFVAQPQVIRDEKGGSWDNPQKFQAINIVPHIDPTFRGNVTIISPSLDQTGAIGGFRYGLQNESAKLNLNALVQIDKLASTLSGVGAALGGASSGSGGAAGSSGQSGAGGSSNSQSGGTQNQAQGLTGPGGAGQGGAGQGGAGRGGAAGGGGIGASGFGSQLGALASQATDATQSFGNKMLMGLPGMTEDVADAILDYLDEDEEPRPYGAEFADYYQQLLPPYKPANGPVATVEQLLLVRGVTPQLLFGYDQNRNGYIDASEQSQMLMGMPAGSAPGALPMPTSTGASGTDAGAQPSMPGPLGWAPYLTLHSQEKNVSSDGTKRININGDDLQLLYEELQTAGVNELLASYIIAYRIGGQPAPGASSPLQALMGAAASANTEDGMLGAQLSAMSGGSSGFGQLQQGGRGGQGGQGGQGQSDRGGQGGGQGQSDRGGQGGGQGQGGQGQSGQQNQRGTERSTGQGGGQGQGGQGQGGQSGGQNGQGGQQQGGNQEKQPWTTAALDDLDLSQQKGNVKFNQILDLIDSSVSLGGQGGGKGGGGGGGSGSGGGGGGNQQGKLYSSPLSALPLALADGLPTLMDKLTTVDSETLPGRINIMECPREILAGVPGMDTELLEAILEARIDGSQTENRRFETWLVVEGLITVDQMRGFLPLMTCGGDVFKAQVIGYFEGSASFCRAEAIISGVGASPTMLFFRRLDHLGRGFDVAALGQRTDVGMTPAVIQP